MDAGGRLRQHRAALLAAGTLTPAELQNLRGVGLDEPTVPPFDVEHGGQLLIPAFQLDDRGGVRPELVPILETLTEAGIHGWALWTWLTSSTGLLSGEVPERLAAAAPSRVLRAAQRFASGTVA